jgi:hypothetical protein
MSSSSEPPQNQPKRRKATVWLDVTNTPGIGFWCYFDSIGAAYDWAIEFANKNHNTQPLPRLSEVRQWLERGTKMVNICHYSAYQLWLYLDHCEPINIHNAVLMTPATAEQINYNLSRWVSAVSGSRQALK